MNLAMDIWCLDLFQQLQIQTENCYKLNINMEPLGKHHLLSWQSWAAGSSQPLVNLDPSLITCKSFL